MTRLEHRIHELTVGQLAERSGVAVSTVHFYESKGLISSRRTAGNQRRFTRDTLRRVSFIRVSQRVGIPLARIREALATLPDERTPTSADWESLSQRWRAELDDRIAQLIALRDDLDECIGCGCLSIRKCALANPYDRLGDEGSGPRILLGDRPRRSAEPTEPTCEDSVWVPCTPDDTSGGTPGSAENADGGCAPVCAPTEG